MNFENNLAFAQGLDQADPLRALRSDFLFPQQNEKPFIYLCGNSLGLQPKAAREVLGRQLDNWHNLAVEGWFEGDEPWMFYHKELKKLIAPIVGASPAEVCPMSTLTVNLHLLMVSFYRPKKKRFKIIMEAGAFPSDQYAIESQVRFHGYDPAEAIIEVAPRQGEYILSTKDILSAIKDNGEDIALVLFGGVNYFTGQWYDMEAITKAGHQAGALVGFDLAHKGKQIFDQLVAGNVLGDWREPNVIRLSPVPMYNSYEDVFRTGELLLTIGKELVKY